MFGDVLKHLGRLLQQLIAPVEEPLHCPSCNRKNALVLIPPTTPSRSAGGANSATMFSALSKLT